MVSERDGIRTEGVVLCEALVEQAWHKHMPDEYKNQYVNDVPPSPSLVKVRDTTGVPSELNKKRGKVKRAYRHPKYVSYDETT